MPKTQARGSAVRLLVILSITAMVTFNLRIMYQDALTSNNEADFENENRLRPVIISMNGQLNQISQTNFTFSSDYFGRPTFNRSHATVIGYNRNAPSFLSIGVPSIKRINGDSYVIGTVQSLIDKSTALEKLQIVVIVYLADLDEHYNIEVAEKLQTRFKEYIQMGFLQITRVSKDYYPKLAGLKRNFRDSAARVQWRAKQVADYSFLFMYAQNQSEYYLQLEDDVLCAPNYFKDIKQFIHIQKQRKWVILEFSELGFIGKLFKNQDLTKLAQFMLTFYAEQPVDWLISHYRLVMTQRDIILRKPTLFQHVGKKSSYDISKDNNLQDRFFAGNNKKWKTSDPPATVLTTMKHHENNLVQLVYASGSGFFWAKDPNMGDSISIIFDSAQKLTQVVVETGNDKNPSDILHSGTVELSSTLIKQDARTGRAICGDPVVIGHVTNGRCNIDKVDKLFKNSARCLIVTVTGNQDNWILFDQIGVFVDEMS